MSSDDFDAEDGEASNEPPADPDTGPIPADYAPSVRLDETERILQFAIYLRSGTSNEVRMLCRLVEGNSDPASDGVLDAELAALQTTLIEAHARIQRTRDVLDAGREEVVWLPTEWGDPLD